MQQQHKHQWHDKQLIQIQTKNFFSIIKLYRYSSRLATLPSRRRQGDIAEARARVLGPLINRVKQVQLVLFF